MATTNLGKYNFDGDNIQSLMYEKQLYNTSNPIVMSDNVGVSFTTSGNAITGFTTLDEKLTAMVA